MLDIFALIVIVVIVALAIWLVITLANIPINIAEKHQHPQVAAITTLSWFGVFTFGLLWIAALVWAQYSYQNNNRIGDESAEKDSAL